MALYQSMYILISGNIRMNTRAYTMLEHVLMTIYYDNICNMDICGYVELYGVCSTIR